MTQNERCYYATLTSTIHFRYSYINYVSLRLLSVEITYTLYVHYLNIYAFSLPMCLHIE